MRVQIAKLLVWFTMVMASAPGWAYVVDGIDFLSTSATTTGGAVSAGGTLSAGISFSLKSSHPYDAVYRVELYSGSSMLNAVEYVVNYTSGGERAVNTQRNGTLSANLGVGTHVLYLRALTSEFGFVGDSYTYTVTVTSAASAPTISVVRNPNPMISGKPYTVTWSTTNATSVYYTCSASGTGFVGSGTLGPNGSVNGTGDPAWVGYPSACTWTATGPGGSKSVSDPLQTINPAPTVSVGASCSASPCTTSSTISLSASASDSNGSINHVEFYQNGSLIATDSSAPYTHTVSGMSAATHTFTARAYDNEGTSTLSSGSSVTVTVPNSAPSLTLNAPSNGATFTSPANIYFQASASDAQTYVTRVEFYNGGTLLATDSSAPYEYTWSNVGVGNYSVSVVAYDSQGLSTTRSINVSVVPPNTPPSVALVNPAPGSNVYVTTLPYTLSLRATASDTGGSISQVEFRYSFGGSDFSLGNGSLSGGNYVLDVPLTTTTPGTYYAYAKATDNTGLTSTSGIANVHVSNPNLPSIGSFNVSGTSFVLPAGTSTTSLSYSASATDANGQVVKLELLNGSTVIDTVNAATTGGNRNVTLGLGTHNLSLRATDNQGGVTTSSAVTVSVANNAPPAVSVSAPAGTVVGQTVTLSATASDSDGTITKVEFWQGSTKLGEDTSAPYSQSWAANAPGTYTFTAKAFDNSGSSTTSATASISVTPDDAASLSTNQTQAIVSPGGHAAIQLTAAVGVPTATFLEIYRSSTGPSSGFSRLVREDTQSLVFNDSVGAGTYWYVAAQGEFIPDWVTYGSGSDVYYTNSPAVMVQVSERGPVIGSVDGIFNNAQGEPILFGWACDKKDERAIEVDLYAGEGWPAGAMLNRVTANLTGETAIATSCGTSNSAFRWNFNLAPFRTDHGGSALYVHGLSLNGGANPLLGNSGTFTIPVIPNTAPTATFSLTAAPTQFYVPVGGTVSLGFNAGSTDAENNVTKLELFNGANATPLWTLNGSSASNQSVTLAKGTYLLRVRATDAKGLSGNSAEITVTVTERGPVKGNVEGVVIDGQGKASLQGWACDQYDERAIGVKLFVGGPSSSGTFLLNQTANLPGEAALATTCGTSNSAFRFSFDLEPYRAAHGGKSIYVQGLSLNGGSHLDIPGSGNYTVPVVSTPVASLDAPNPSNVRVAVGAQASIRFTGSASVGTGKITKLELFRDTGSGYESTAFFTQTTDAANVSLNELIPLGANAYRIKLRATNNVGQTAESQSHILNITDSPLLGTVDGVRINAEEKPELIGWVCQESQTGAVNVQVHVNAPGILGGTPITTGTANLIEGSDSAAVQSACKTPGTGHRFKIDLSAYTSQYAGAPIYVTGTAVTSSAKIILPCADNTCTMPASLRIALTNPANNDRATAPANLFAKAKLTNVGAGVDEVAIAVDDQWQTAQPDTEANTWYISKPNLSARAAPYWVKARVRQGNTTLYSLENAFYVDASATTTLNLATPTGSFIAPAIVNLSATVGGDTAAVTKVEFLNSQGQVVTTGTQNGNTWSANWYGLLAGNHAVKARALNAQGAVVTTTIETTFLVTTATGPSDATPIAVDITPPHLSNADAGTLPGELGVNASGAATYSIPIAVPPGTNGMQPNLSLNYSSQAGNGLLGMGWSLSGTQQITRCRQNWAQDQDSKPLSLNQDDRLCLNGERLVLASGNDYWSSDATYRTERERFDLIKRDGNGFKVMRRDGLIDYFGATDDSRIEAQGSTEVLSWALSRKEQRKGGYTDYRYIESNATGEWHLDSIVYGSLSAGVSKAVARVQLVYENRPDTSSGYVVGSLTSNTQRLKHVETYAEVSDAGTGGTLANRYQFAYETSPYSGRSLLSTIQACDNGGHCLPATSLEWSKVTVPAAGLQWVKVGDWSLPVVDRGQSGQYEDIVSTATGDFNGDGRTDYARYTKTRRILIGLSTGSGFDNREINIAEYIGPFTDNISGYNNGSKMLAMDFEGDGSTELLILPGLRNASQLAGSAYGRENYFPPIKCRYVRQAGNFACSTMNHSEDTDEGDYFTPGQYAAVDLSGKGRYGLMLIRSRVMDTIFANDNEFNYPVDYLGDAGPNWYCDGEGGGCVQLGNNTVPTELSPLSITALNQVWFGGGPPGPHVSVVGDFNQDGRTDFNFIRFESTTQALQVNCYGADGRFACPQSATSFEHLYNAQTVQHDSLFSGLPYLIRWSGSINLPSQSADINEDGYSDLIFANNAVGYCLTKADSKLCKALPFRYAAFGNFAGVSGSEFIAESAGHACRYRAGDWHCLPIQAPIGFSRKIVSAGPDSLGQTNQHDEGVMVSGDFLGNGKLAIAYILDKDGTATLFQLNTTGLDDKLVAVVNGLGHRAEVSYSRGIDTAVYDNALGEFPREHPVRPGLEIRALVKELRTSNGQGGWVRKGYQYAGAAFDQLGRGSLGFARTKVTDLDTGMQQHTEYRQDWPFVGLVKQAKTLDVDGSRITQTDNVYQQRSLTLASGLSTHFAYLEQTTEARWELDGTPISTTTVINTYGDDYGNLTQQSHNAVGGGTTFNTTTTQSYRNAESTWLLGLPEFKTVIKQSSGSTIKREIELDYDDVGSVKTEIIEPNQPALKVTTELDRSNNAFGLVGKKTQTWTDPVTGTTKSRVAEEVIYEPKGRFPQTVKNALGQAETRGYDAATGKQTRLVGPNGIETRWVVDAFGQVKKEIRHDDTDSTKYTEVRQYLKQCDTSCPIGATTVAIVDTFKGTQRTSVPSLVYRDSAGHELRKQTYGFDGRAIVVDTRYDSRGRVWEVYQPTFDGTTAKLASRMTYDNLNRVTKVETPSDTGALVATTTAYNGLDTTTTNPKTQTKTDTRNVVGQLVRTKDALNGETLFGRDAWGNLTKTTDPAGNVIEVVYDLLGRKIELKDPDLGRIEYSVDPLGRVYRQISPKARAAAALKTLQADKEKEYTRTEYDDLNRMTARYEPNLESHWVYDHATNPSNCAATKSCGQLVEAYTGTSTNKTYSRIHTYDSLGRPDTTTTQLDTVYVSTQSYDSWGRPISRSERRGTDVTKTRKVENRYNGYGYLKHIERNGLKLWEAIKQDAANRVETAQLGNGLIQTREYNEHTGLLNEGEYTNAAQQSKMRESYSYDVLGNVDQRTHTWSGTNSTIEGFSYDGLNRLATATVTGQPTQYFEYNAIGNLTRKTGVGTGLPGSYRYPTQGATAIRPHAVDSIDGVGSFSYDANGNMTSGAGRNISWTSFDMPLCMTKGSIQGDGSCASGATTWSQFVYGPEHQRLKQLKQDGSIVYAGAMEVELDSSSAVKRIKTYWPQGLGVEIEEGGNTQLRWTHVDRLGSVVGISDEAGNFVEQLGFDAWGKRRNLNGNGTPDSLDGQTDNKGYTGHEMLDALDLVHMNGRVYDPLVARFMSADPLIQEPEHSQSYNRYTYVWNNPTNLTDPTGFAARRLPGAQGTVDEPEATVAQTDAEGGQSDLEEGEATSETSSGSVAGDQIRTTSSQNQRDTSNPLTECLQNPHCHPSQAMVEQWGETRSPSNEVGQSLLNGTETAITGGYGRRMTEAYKSGEYGAAAGNLFAGVAYGAMNIATLGRAGSVANVSRNLFAKFVLGEANVAARSVWALHPFERGVAIEKALGQNLPANFPVIDKFEKGVATSIKSLDLGAKSYQSVSALSRTVSSYVDSVAAFTSRTWANVTVTGVTARELVIAVPHTGNTAQQAAMSAAVQYGASKGVAVKVVVYP
ncbi:Ig-like domain-containing protein [Chitinimonas sp. BJYL2]|uniref:Ig-like domain-containing protein n=1 Tax=Chitinimonas sp. BJYL2 TaxID=2976696 RepID=UPI0022B398C2|nr:Ig-like domain-containing protein [Chitinimonas sp. BJYL2]